MSRREGRPASRQDRRRHQESQVRKPANPTDDSTEKLQKVLARSGCGSRRALEKLIEAGEVRVNGAVAKLGDRIRGDEKVTLKGQRVNLRASQKSELPRVLIYNKPEGEVCTRNDPEGRPTVYMALPKIPGSRWVSVGRLDINTSGLLLMTDSGELAHKLMHPSSQIDREYRVRLFGEVTQDKLQQLSQGVELEDGPARFTDIHLDGEKDGRNQWATVTLMEGRNREVRRLWESQDIQVSRLKRVRYGPVILPGRVPRGRWTECSPEEVQQLLQALEQRQSGDDQSGQES